MSTLMGDDDERDVQRPPRDVSFYVVLVFIVAPLYLVGPASWAYIGYSLHYGRPRSWLFHAATVESAFSLYYLYLARRVNSAPLPPHADPIALKEAYQRVLQSGLSDLPDGSDDEESTVPQERPGSPEESIIQLTRDDPRALDFRTRLRTWFSHARWSALHKQEVMQWLYWSMFNRALPFDIPEHHQTALDEAISLLEMRAGCVFPVGTNSAVKPLLLSVDQLNVRARPLVWYLFVKVANWLAMVWFCRKYEVTRGTTLGLEYLIRIPQTNEDPSTTSPIVILHGLGLGFLQYYLLLDHLIDRFPNRAVLIPLQPHISQDIFHIAYLTPMNRPTAVTALDAIIRSHGWDKTGVTMFSHSNGSFYHAWMLKARLGYITRSCFVDPVTFCSWEGDVCYNFIYRRCTDALELIMSYFVGTELGVANTLQRNFDWTSNSLWYEDIPNARDPSKTVYFVGGKDAIVNAERVKRYLRSHGVGRKALHYNPEGAHGSALMTGSSDLARVVEWLGQS